jgi:dipeptidyl aminopeptidase/acylaminoacyl peptidase
MLRPRRVVPFALVLCAACAPAVEPPPVPPPPAPPPPPASMAIATAAPSASAPTATKYEGHGLASVPKEVLAKYRPRTLAPEVSRRIQAMLDLRPPTAGRMSPDGKHLFFNWSITGVSQIFRLDAPGGFPTQVTGGEDGAIAVGVTPDGAHLVVSRDRKGEENPGLYLQDAKKGGALTKIQHEAGVQTRFEGISRDSKWVYFSANDRKKDSYVVYRWSIEGKSREVVFDQEGLWTVDDLGDDGRLLLSRATGGASQEISLWDPAKKALTPVAGQGQREEHRAAFGAGGETLVLTNATSDKRRLYRLDAAGKPVAISPELPHDVASFSIDRSRTRILYTVNEGGFTRLFALDAKSHKPLALPKLPAADHVRPGPTTPDGRFTTVSIDDGKGPPHAHVIDWKSSSVTAWHHPSAPEIDTSGFAKTEITSYPARDGTKIPVLVRRPAKCASDPCAVVIAFHGGPEGQALPGFSVGGQSFVDAGFVYVEPNVRGSDGYGKAWLHADDGPKRLEVITDIEDASIWARKELASGGKPPKVGIYGGSYGGYSSLIGMTMFAGAYDAGVDVVGISNLITFLENTAPYRRSLRTSEYGDPEKDRDALIKLSPTTYVDRVKAPLLILQGATDPRVPAGEAVQMHEALTGRGVASELMIFPDEGHGAQRRENQVLFLGHSIAFFEKHLLGK